MKHLRICGCGTHASTKEIACGLLDNSPYDFIINHEDTDLEKLIPFVHRTFNGNDCIQFIKSLQHIYKNHNGLESVFSKHVEKESMQHAISKFKTTFFEVEHLQRTEKHVDKARAEFLNIPFFMR